MEANPIQATTKAARTGSVLTKEKHMQKYKDAIAMGVFTLTFTFLFCGGIVLMSWLMRVTATC